MSEDEQDGMWAFGKIKLALTVEQAGKNEAVALVEKGIPRKIYTQTSSKTSCCSHAWIAKGSMSPQPRSQ